MKQRGEAQRQLLGFLYYLGLVYGPLLYWEVISALFLMDMPTGPVLPAGL